MKITMINKKILHCGFPSCIEEIVIDDPVLGPVCEDHYMTAMEVVNRHLTKRLNECWAADCVELYGRELTGAQRHYCLYHNFAPVDETFICKCCKCFTKE